MEDDADVLAVPIVSAEAAAASADVVLAAPAVKRPRVGRPAQALLAAIEADCGAGGMGLRDPAPGTAAAAAPAWMLPVREALLALTAPTADVAAAARVVRAGAVAAARADEAGAAAAVAELLCEACVRPRGDGGPPPAVTDLVPKKKKKTATLRPSSRPTAAS